MNARIILPIALVLLTAAFSCKPKQAAIEPTKSVDVAPPVSTCAPILRGAAPYHDPLFEVASNLAGDCLELKYSYSGGCKPHDIELYWSGNFTETIPPGTKIWLSHNANEDACKAIESGKKSFDLKPLRYAGVGQVVIDLILEEGKMQRINYVYPMK